MDFNQVKVRLKQTSGDQNQWKVQRFRWAGFGLLKTCIIPWILKVSKFPFNLFILFKKISLIWYPRLPYSTSTNTYGAQCPRTDFNKRSIPRPKTTTTWKLITHRCKIARIEILHCTEMHFASFLSGGFFTAIVVNLPERKLVKRISVHCGTTT